MNKDRDRNDRPRDDRPRDDRGSGGYNDRPRYGDRNDRPREDRPRDDRGSGGYNDRPRYGGSSDRPRYGSGGYNDRERGEDNGVYGEKLRAGKRRTYFFDIRTTRNNDFYLTVTESKKRLDDTQERHKIYVYKEDLNKFLASLQKTIDHLKNELLPDYDFDQFNNEDDYQDRNDRPRYRSYNDEADNNETNDSSAAEDAGDGDEFSNEIENTLPVDENVIESDNDQTANKDDLTWD